MTPFCSFLITLTDGMCLYKVALKMDVNKFTGDAFESPLEPENKTQYKFFIGGDWDDFQIVDVEIISDIVEVK